MKSPLKIEDVRPSLPFEIRPNSGGLPDIRLLTSEKYGYKLDFDVFLESKGKNLQRPFCWTIEQKRELIISLLKGIDVKGFAVIKYTDERKSPREEVFQIIDGKQRLSTIMDFVYGKFDIIVNGESYFFKDLDNMAQYEIYKFHPVTSIVYEYWDTKISDDDKIKWFEMINFAGTAQDIEHLNNLKK